MADAIFLLKKVQTCVTFVIYVFEKMQTFGVIFILTPGYYIILLTLVRRMLVHTYDPGLLQQMFDLIISWFGFTNLAGNMMMSILTDSTVKKAVFSNDTAEYCEICDIYRPEKSWHCKTCNACILKRDHHCIIFSRCIGLLNQRYYVLYLFYLPVCIAYFTYYWYYYLVARQLATDGLYLNEYHIAIPFLKFITKSYQSFTILELEKMMLLINVALFIWTLSLFVFHLKNLLQNQTSHEARISPLNCSLESLLDWANWKMRMEHVFGIRWYFAIIWPFISSPLPSKSNLPSTAAGFRKLY